MRGISITDYLYYLYTIASESPPSTVLLNYVADDKHVAIIGIFLYQIICLIMVGHQSEFYYKVPEYEVILHEYETVFEELYHEH